MSVILLVLGILLSATGGALIGFGIPAKELSHGPTLILAGAFAVVGGLLLVGLSAVVSELARVTAALKAPPTLPQPAAVPAAHPVLPVPTVEPAARQAGGETAHRQGEQTAEDVPRKVVSSSVTKGGEPATTTPPVAADVSASAVERLRSTIPRPDQVIPEAPDTVPLSPNGQFGAHRVEPPVSEPVSRSAAASVETRERRLDFLFRPRQAHQTHAGPAPRESVEASWSRRPVADVNTADPRLEVARAPSPPPATRAATEPKPAQAPQPRTVAILKSGVVDGMAYTLYADGSIEAQLPQGTVRFGSIAELRAHIENKG